MYTTTSKIILLLLPAILFSCSKTVEKKDSNTQTQVIDSNLIELTIERGAFHYDRFVLKDTIITFYPSAEMVENNKYNVTSSQNITIQQRDELINYLQEKSFFKLKNRYSNQTSDNSILKITLKMNGKNKTIECDDFERGCPEILQYIEQQIIALHNKGLKRIYLPG
ncbi:hypothetical protein [Aquimarina algiphila]|uniref:DUF6438 domain-containing protein n=1 Tax=Aquimarina algiphila TaxID=2047982 RepID=UPI002492D50B|nr:hypothetical protein [Aquimarina algiphila]